LEAVVCQGLTKRYRDIAAVDSLDLSVEEGVIFGFLGPNGAGKTTTVRMLVGLSHPTGGRAFVAGEEIGRNSISLRGKIGYLPEEPAFYSWMTGREYLEFVGDAFGLPRGESKRRSQELLEMIELKDVAGRRIGGYSRGMRQRLGIAQALMNKPSVLFLDEPSSALDPMGRVEILDTLRRLKAEATTTIFLSSHILSDVERVSDVVGIIDKGRLVVKSSVDELRRRFARSVFQLEFEEPAADFVGFLRQLPWVSKVDSSDDSGGSKLVVHVGDASVAKAQLPGLVAQSGLTLRQYQLALPSLEEVFIELVGGREE
jgi:ABC-2 type transport system ATP-binding protein